LDLLLYILGFLTGILSGMGVGGGSLLVPALLILGKANQVTAQGVCLASFLPVALAAIITHLKQKQIEIPFLPKLIPGALLGAALGAVAAGRIPTEWLQAIFGAFLCLWGGYECLSGLLRVNEKTARSHPDESTRG
jgi:uncharacterized membrane protein YfcA